MPEVGIAVATLAGPWGPYQLAVTARGVVAAEWSGDRAAFEARLARRLGADLAPDPVAGALLERLLPVVERLLAGEPVDAAAIPLDLADRPAFDRRVLLAVQAVPWGATASYGDIARQAGAPRAARAVGGAVGRNPISMIVPCHRVIAADGTIGGYGGDGPADRAAGLAWKRELLSREGRSVPGRPG